MSDITIDFDSILKLDMDKANFIYDKVDICMNQQNSANFVNGSQNIYQKTYSSEYIEILKNSLLRSKFLLDKSDIRDEKINDVIK